MAASSPPAERTIPEVEDCWNRIGIWSSANERCERLADLHHCRNCDVFARNARAILDQPVGDEYKIEWARRLERHEDGRVRGQGAESLFLFRIGDQWLGIRTRLIEVVDGMSRFHSIPNARDSILRGLVNVRGELKVCVSIGRLLQIGPSNCRKGCERVVVVREGERCFAFPVSEARGMTCFREDELKDAPHNMLPGGEHLVAGVLTLEEMEIACLDETLLLTTIAERIR